MPVTYGISASVEGRTRHFDIPLAESATAVEDPRRLGLEIVFHRIGSSAPTLSRTVPCRDFLKYTPKTIKKAIRLATKGTNGWI
jgi:hypothetical protein